MTDYEAEAIVRALMMFAVIWVIIGLLAIPSSELAEVASGEKGCLSLACLWAPNVGLWIGSLPALVVTVLIEGVSMTGRDGDRLGQLADGLRSRAAFVRRGVAVVRNGSPFLEDPDAHRRWVAAKQVCDGPCRTLYETHVRLPAARLNHGGAEGFDGWSP